MNVLRHDDNDKWPVRLVQTDILEVSHCTMWSHTDAYYYTIMQDHTSHTNVTVS